MCTLPGSRWRNNSRKKGSEMWPGSPQGFAEGGGAAGRASYPPTPRSGRAAVGVSVHRLQSS